MNRRHIRSAEWNLEQAKQNFYRKDRKEVREYLIKAIRHITKTLLVV